MAATHIPHVVIFLFALLLRAAAPAQLNGTYLLYDTSLLQSVDVGLSFKTHRPDKLDGPIIVAEYPWEEELHFYGAVVTVSPTDHRLYYACKVHTVILLCSCSTLITCSQ